MDSTGLSRLVTLPMEDKSADVRLIDPVSPNVSIPWDTGHIRYETSRLSSCSGQIDMRRHRNDQARAHETYWE